MCRRTDRLVPLDPAEGEQPSTGERKVEVALPAEIGDQRSTCGSPDLAFGRFRAASYWLVDENRCLQEDDLAVPGAVTVLMSSA